MSLEKNIERIADALEAIAKVAGGKDTAIKTPSVQNQSGQQMPQGSGQAPVHRAGSRIPVSLPSGSGMQWPGAGAQQT